MMSDANPINTGTAEHSRRWGLLPDPINGQSMQFTAWLRYYFVEFNPLYFISTCCILYGVSLVAHNVDALNLHSHNLEQLLLFATTEFYEALLITGAAILVHRTGARRPAALLCLLECVMLFDCTFRLESVVLLGAFGASLILCWIGLTCIKLWGLAKAMHITLSSSHYAAMAATVASIVAVIVALSYPGSNKLLVLQMAAWLGAFVIMVLEIKRAPLASLLASSDKQRAISERCIKAGYRILIGFYFYHIWAYIVMVVEPDMLMAAIFPQAATFLLLQIILQKKESSLWSLAFLMLLSTCLTPLATTLSLAVIATAFLYRVIKGAHSNLALGAACCVYAAAWLAGWQGLGHALPNFPAAIAWPTIMLVIAMAAIAIFMRNKISRVVLTGGLLYTAYLHLSIIQWLPKTELGIGMLIMGGGFVTLAVGIFINWRFRSEAISYSS